MDDDFESELKLKENVELLNKNITALEFELASVRDKNYKNFWDLVKNINDLFKSTKLYKDDREKLWSRHCAICDKAKTKQQEQTREAIKTIESALSMLEYHSHRGDYKDFWDNVKVIPSIFKNQGPLPKEERARLWNKYQGLCESVKRTQTKYFDERNRVSKLKKEEILRLIKDASHQIQGSRNLDELKIATIYLNNAMRLMKKSNDYDDLVRCLLEPSGNILTRDDREICWNKWTSVNDEFPYKRDFFYQNNYDKIASIAGQALNAANYDRPKDAKNLVKEAQIQMKSHPMNDTQYATVKDMLQNAWQIATIKSDQNRENYRQNQVEYIMHLQSLNADLESRISNERRHIDDNYDKIRNAHNEDFINMIENEWIPEQEGRIAKFESFIIENNQKIRECESKL